MVFWLAVVVALVIGMALSQRKPPRRSDVVETQVQSQPRAAA
jgi:hypothetical protein